MYTVYTKKHSWDLWCTKVRFSHVILDYLIGNNTIVQISLSGWLDPWTSGKFMTLIPKKYINQQYDTWMQEQGAFYDVFCVA